MSVEVKIPAVGESIESGVVSVWHKKSGEYVEAGEALLTLETDKVSTEITAEKAGVLETKVDEGQEVKIGEVVAVIDDKAPAPAKGKEKEAAAEGIGADRETTGQKAIAKRRGPFSSREANDHGRETRSGQNQRDRQRRAPDERRRHLASANES